MAQCHKKVMQVESSLAQISFFLLSNVTSYNSAEKTHVNSKQNHLSKLKALMKHKQKQPELCSEARDCCVVNLTKRNLTPSQQEVLRMGLRTSFHQVSPAGHQC